MTTCLGKSCSFGLLCVSFVGICYILCVCPSFPVGIEGRIWDVVVLIPGSCLSINFTLFFSERRLNSYLLTGI